MVRDPSSEHTVDGYREMTPEADLEPAHTCKHKDIHELLLTYEHALTYTGKKCNVAQWLCASALHNEALGLITRVRDERFKWSDLNTEHFQTGTGRGLKQLPPVRGE